MQAVQNKED